MSISRINRARMFTATTGNAATPIALGAAVSGHALTMAEAGAVDGAIYYYEIVQGDNFEEQCQVWTSSGNTLARGTPVRSRVGGTLGATRITLDGSAVVRILGGALVEQMAIPAPHVGMRGSLSATAAVTSADYTAATAISLVPNGQRPGILTLHDGNDWREGRSGVINFDLDSNSGHTGYHQSGKIFTLFGAISGGVPVIGTGPAWSSDTSPGAGAGTSETEMFEGAEVNKYDLTTLRNGSNTYSIAAHRALKLLTFRATANGQTEDSKAKRLLSNVFNATSRKLKRADATATWNQDTADGLVQAHSDAANKVEFLDCLGSRKVIMEANMAGISRSATQATFILGIGLDTVGAGSEDIAVYGSATNAAYVAVSARYEDAPGIGYHYLSLLTSVIGANGTWFSNGNHGLLGSIDG